MRTAILLTFISFILFSCNNSGKKKEVIADSTNWADSLIAPQQVDDPLRDSTLLALTKQVLSYLKTKKYDSLAQFIHAEKGVRFSPYAFIDTMHDKVISVELLNRWTDKKKQEKINWGNKDATGDPIISTIDEYVNSFVYDVDFSKADSTKVNQFIGGGNAQNNLLPIYPGHNFVESYFKGADKKMEGMDWRSLRLVFKYMDSKYYLVGMVHDEWTI
jgi:phage terminase large subunit-like protein